MMIKLVKRTREGRHRNVTLQNERKKRCWAKIAEMDKSRLKTTIIWVTTSSSSSSSSSFYWASVANAPNVLQPYWLIVLPLDVPALTASLLLWGPSGQRWRCLWTFLFSNVPTFDTSRLQEILAAKGGTTWAKNGRWILPENARLPHNIQGSFTCRKSTTWDSRIYFPSEGRRAEDFFALKNPTASVGFEPANLGTKGQHSTSRPSKPLWSPFLMPEFSANNKELYAFQKVLFCKWKRGY